MKNKIIAALVLIITANAYSQTTLPNMSFDSWTYSTYYNEPSGGVWTTANKAILINPSLFPATTDTTTDAVAGPYAAKMTTKLSSTIPAMLLTGTLATGVFDQTAIPPANLKMGMPFTGRPLRFTGYYKYTDNAGDSCDIYAILSEWIGGARQTIGDARLRSSVTVTQYTKFDITFNYYSTDTPDSISIVFASSAAGNLLQGHAGSTLYIDNTALEYDNGFEMLMNPSIQVKCYPVPAVSSVNFSLNRELKDGMIKIFTETGSEVKSESIFNKDLVVPVNNLSAGKYYYKITEKGLSLNTGWFIVE